MSTSHMQRVSAKRVAEIAARQPTWMSGVWVDSALASLGLTYDRDARKAAVKVADRIDFARLLHG